jgi:hypothetical protein
MLHCLFPHSAGRAVGGLAVRVGERVLVRNASVSRAAADRPLGGRPDGAAHLRAGLGALGAGRGQRGDRRLRVEGHGRRSRAPRPSCFSRPVETMPAPPA